MMLTHRWTIAIIFICSFLILGAAPVTQSQSIFGTPAVDYVFGEQATFTVPLTDHRSIQSLFLHLQPGDGDLEVIELPLPPAGQPGVYVHPLDVSPFPPFGIVKYQFRASLSDGSKVSSPEYSFEYSDNRFEWQMLENDQIQVFWQEGDTGFGQAALNAAAAGLDNALQILPVDIQDPIRVYIYPGTAALQSIPGTSMPDWAGGLASDQADAALLSVLPGAEQRLELERQAPHEIMHLVLRRAAPRNYANVPAWFAEGLASLAELYPNPEYERMLLTASQERTLIPLETLCSRFPSEERNVYLAYAEAESFMRYVYRNHGSSGIARTLAAYENGLSCEAGVQTGLEISLEELESRWQSEMFGETSQASNAADTTAFGPYLALSLLVLLPPLIIPLSLRWKD